MATSKRKLTANTLKADVAHRFVKKRHAVTFEFGLCKRGRLRADVFSMTIYGDFTIIEIKSCKQDFVTDTKHHRYLRYCNKFYFAFDTDTWAKLKDEIDLPKGTGVMVASNGKLRVVRKSARREIPDKIRLSLALRMAYRASQFTSLAHVRGWRKENGV